MRSGNPKSLLTTLATFAALVGASAPLSAQDWPNRPITMVVPFSAGGPADVLGRILAPRLSEVLRQNVIIENISAGGGLVGTARVAAAAPDGYTFVYGNIATHAQSQALYKKRLYNAATDFDPVILTSQASTVLSTRKDLPVGNLREFIAYTKAHQKKMQYGSGGAASPSHLACVLVNAAIGVDVTHVPYRGASPAMQDLIAGHIDYQCPGTASAIPIIKSGQIKAIAMLSRERSPSLPELATAHEQGLTDLEAETWSAFFLPKGTPAAINQKLREAVIAAMDTPMVRQRFGEVGAFMVGPERRSPDYLQAFVEREIERWTRAIKAAGIEPQ
jgi:tripartite-type tricarboxylate transporter receptor subunit TctC